MNPTSDQSQIVIPEGATLLLRDLIHERLGIYYDETHLYLMVDKVTPLLRLKNFTSLSEYYFYLKQRPHFSDDWRRVMDALSVQETYFFREMDQIHALTKVLVPQWFERTNELLRIWVAASASGEEAFTIAIALEEAGYGNYPIEIIGSDASEAALEKARAGIFRERAFRTIAPEVKAKYFTPHHERWTLHADILRRVRFERVNLVAAVEVSELARSPIIFCRNVFIYFSKEVIARTVRRFAEWMPPNGYLCVGASESLLKVSGDFDIKEIGGAFIYVRKPELGKEPDLLSE